MRQIITAGLTGIFVLALFSGADAKGKVWVSSAGAKLKAEKSSSSKTIADLAVGAELSVESIEDKWYKVTAKSGEKGWIYRGKVSNEQPKSKSSKGDDSLTGTIAKSTIGSGSADTSRSIRGLSYSSTERKISDEAKAYAERTGADERHRKALEVTLSFYPSSDEIDRFLKDGKIGEYAQ